MANTDKPAAKKPAKTPAKTSQDGVAKKTAVPKKKEPKLTDKVRVVSCSYGKLIYVNKHTGFTAEWGHFGDFVDMTVEELTAMRNGQRAFFENQWVLLTGDNADAVIEFLQLEKYYDTITSVQDIDNLFRCAPEEIPGVLSRFTRSAKETIARRAKELIDDTSLSDINIIRALEESLGYDLIS